MRPAYEAGGFGGGGGFSGGGGGEADYGYGGGGGGSCLAPAFSDQVLLSGVNAGNGYVTIDLIEAAAAPTVPEPATWAMMAAGFAGLGFLGLRRGRKPEPSGSTAHSSGSVPLGFPSIG